MLRVISYGGGVQSTALLVLAAQGKIDFKTFLFCNVGDDSEHPATIEYVRDVAMPYAKAHGIELLELHKVLRTGEIDTIYQRLTRPGSRSIGIPVRMSNGAPGNRACTGDFKINVVDKWLKDNGIRELLKIEKAFKPGTIDRPILAQVGLGISLDELQRVKPNMDPSTQGWKENVFPLLFEVEKPMDRQACIQVIEKAGLPVPPKSACWFCPYHRLSKWQEMRQKEDALFWKAVELERFINKRREDLGKDQVWFTGKLVPLDAATTSLQQNSLFDDHEDMCESGYCWI